MVSEALLTIMNDIILLQVRNTLCMLILLHYFRNVGNQRNTVMIFKQIFLSFLGTDCALALFSLYGKIPISKDRRHRCHIIGVSSVAHVFKEMLVIPFGLLIQYFRHNLLQILTATI